MLNKNWPLPEGAGQKYRHRSWVASDFFLVTFSELEETIRTKQELLKKLDKEWSEATSPREKEEALRVEDLQGDGPEVSGSRVRDERE